MDIVLSSKTLQGEIEIPPSKSYLHRALIMAFLSNKKVIIKNVIYSKDVIATLNGLKKLGGRFYKYRDKIISLPKKAIDKSVVINAIESASTLRFLIPLSLCFSKKVKFVGSKNLFSRPLDIYENLFKENNVKFIKKRQCLLIEGNFSPNSIKIKGNVSSQFISGLIFYLICKNSTAPLKITSKISSRNYLKMTLKAIKDFGINFSFKNNTFKYLSSDYKSFTYLIEKDYSQLAFFACYAAIKNQLSFAGFNLNSLQGDKKILSILKSANAKITKKKHILTIYPSKLNPIDVSIDNCIDLGPILFVLCAFIEGKSNIRDFHRLQYKESDRLNLLYNELIKAGVAINITNQAVSIEGKKEYSTNCEMDSHNDHRIAMALTIFALINNGTIKLKNAESVSKSFPNFFKVINVDL